MSSYREFFFEGNEISNVGYEGNFFVEDEIVRVKVRVYIFVGNKRRRLFLKFLL